MNRRISVITPSLNSARFIEDAIRSVLNQGYDNFEHIIIDGGSTDGTIAILKKYPHLKWISEPDKGQSDAMNKGFKVSTGEIVVYLNSDDYFEPGAFNSVLPYFEGGAQFVVGKVKVLAEDGSFFINDPKTKLGEMLRWWEPDAFSCCPVGYFYRRGVQESIGGFNPLNIDYLQHFHMDLEFLLEASRRCAFTKIDSILGVFRLHQATKTTKTSSYTYDKSLYGFCDRYLEYFDRKYVREYLRSRKQYLKDQKRKELMDRSLLRRPLMLAQVSPAEAWEGAGFNVQPNGQSALVITAENATRRTVAILGDARLATAYGGPKFLTALVAPELLMRPGHHRVYLTDGVRESNPVNFVVYPRRG